MAEQTYGRGQVEWALWCSFSRAQMGNAPQVFRTRIKRLLEIDRNLDIGEFEVPPEADYAFTPLPSAATGEVVAYQAEDAFCLAIALGLLDAGFKQAEVVFLMRYLRSDLQRLFPNLLAPPSLVSRQLYRAQDYPDFPSYEVGDQSYADRRVFVILQTLELTEILPPATRERFNGPVILEPIYCDGIKGLGEELNDLMPEYCRALTVLEMAATAQAVQEFLDIAPVIRRGRPSKN